MTPRLSVRVMAHPKRERFIPPLLDRLGIGDDRVVWDRRDDRWDTGRRAMLACDSDATHHLVVQDDALMARDLIAGVERALAEIPAGTAMCLFMSRATRFWQVRSRPPRGRAWLVMHHIHWGQGIVMPTALIPTVVGWGDEHPEVENYDIRLGRWFDENRVPVYYPWPSWMDHLPVPSLIPGRPSGGRHARWWIGERASVLDEPLNRPAVTFDPVREQPATPRRLARAGTSPYQPKPRTRTR